MIKKRIVFVSACATIICNLAIPAPIDSFTAGKQLHLLFLSNYLLDQYTQSECKDFVSKVGIKNLTDSNSRTIDNIIRKLPNSDQVELGKLKDSPDTKMRFQKIAKTYIFDALTEQKKGVGGVAFACGFAYGNVLNFFKDAMLSSSVSSKDTH